KLPFVLRRLLSQNVALERLRALDRAASAYAKALFRARLRFHLRHDAVSFHETRRAVPRVELRPLGGSAAAELINQAAAWGPIICCPRRCSRSPWRRGERLLCLAAYRPQACSSDAISGASFS